MKELAIRIRKFLDTYAVKPTHLDGQFNGPDPSMLEHAADCLEQGIEPDRVWSEWGSGCYKPYSSTEGRKEHDEIIKELSKHLNK